MRLPLLLSALVLAFSLTACKQSESQTNPPVATPAGQGQGGMQDDEFEGREVVTNYEAKTGDVTVCPFSGKKFEVKDDSPRFEWQGKSWVFCCDNCLDKIEADPEKYLGKYLEPATTPAEADETKTEAKTEEPEAESK